MPDPGTDTDSWNLKDTCQAAVSEANANAAQARAATAAAAAKAAAAITNGLNSQLGEIPDSIPPGEQTGYPPADYAVTGYEILKWGWNAIFNQ